MRSWLFGSVVLLSGCSSIIGLDDFHPADSEAAGAGGAGGTAGAAAFGGAAGDAGSSGQGGTSGGGMGGDAGATVGGTSGQGGIGGFGGGSGMGGAGAASGGGGVGGSSGAAGASGSAGMGAGGSAGIGGTMGAGGSAMTGGTGGTGVVTCNAASLPEDDDCVVDEQYGVFVKPNGSDGAGVGSRAAPFATLGKAMSVAKAAGKRVYVCADGGSYASPVSLNANHTGVQAFGSFKCADWSYDASLMATIAPATGVALAMDGLNAGTRIDGFEFRAANATSPGVSSVAAFVRNCTGVSFVRARFEAGRGANGGTGVTADFTYPGAGELGGDSAVGTAGAKAKMYSSCPGGGSTAGGPGGRGGSSPTAGTAGTPDLGSGFGGTLVANCNVGGGAGSPGGNAATASAGAGATTLGTLTSSGWAPSGGMAGVAGDVGQGGGGARGTIESGGGGGGAGGCGGAGGAAGTGGGASIALLVDSSSLSVAYSVLESSQAGDGGAGALGQVGMNGGSKGLSYQGKGCDGGNGGKGGDGGPGGGGAGGISASIVYTGTAPTVTFSTLTPGGAGSGGPAVGGGNAGVNGTSTGQYDAN